MVQQVPKRQVRVTLLIWVGRVSLRNVERPLVLRNEKERSRKKKT